MRRWITTRVHVSGSDESCIMLWRSDMEEQTIR